MVHGKHLSFQLINDKCRIWPHLLMKTTRVIKSVIWIGYILLHFQNKGTHKGKYLVLFRRDYSFTSPVVDFLGHHNLYSSFAPIFIAPAGITPSYTCDFNQIKTIYFSFLNLPIVKRINWRQPLFFHQSHTFILQYFLILPHLSNMEIPIQCL